MKERASAQREAGAGGSRKKRWKKLGSGIGSSDDYGSDGGSSLGKGRSSRGDSAERVKISSYVEQDARRKRDTPHGRSSSKDSAGR